MSIKQISVFVENKAGALLSITNVLAANGIDMRALALSEASDFGIGRMIVSDVYAATTVLKDAGVIHSISPVLAVAIPNVPGGLNQVLKVLGTEGINVEYMYAFQGKASEDAYMVFKVADDIHA
ncbi:MAG: acetolactate synthase, partial [Clostridia bacterium]|nr:acetolactate synthase [Clostridia bacterium]